MHTKAAALQQKAVRHGAVSRALKAVRTGDITSGEDTLRIVAATDLDARIGAYRLAYQLYRAKAYVPPNDHEMIVDPTDLRADTITLLARTQLGEAAATATLVFDGPGGLPCDALYRAEMDQLRARGMRGAEVTRLAIAEAHAHHRILLVRIINLVVEYARLGKRRSHLIIEVNPRHVGFYRRFMLCEVIGDERACPRVSGAPAVLMALDLKRCEEALAAPNNPQFRRTLYPQFLSRVEAAREVSCLRGAQRPMTAAQAEELGLAPVRVCDTTAMA